MTLFRWNHWSASTNTHTILQIETTNLSLNVMIHFTLFVSCFILNVLLFMRRRIEPILYTCMRDCVHLWGIDHNEKDGGDTFYQNALRSEIVSNSKLTYVGKQA